MLVWTVVAAALALGGLGMLLWGLAYRRLVYTLAEHSLDVTWLDRTLLVPYASIEGIYTGQRVVGSAVPKAPTWPGIYIGSGRARGLGRLRFYTTSPDPAALTVIAAETRALVVSARDPMGFRAALIERVDAVDASETVPAAWTFEPVGSAPWSAIRDRWLFVCAGITFALLLITLAAIALGFGALPPEVAIRFDASGQPALIASAESLLRLPLVGAALALLNAALGVWLHPRERLLARLLWAGGAAVMAIVMVAVVRLLQ
jgi:hypothetical protein